MSALLAENMKNLCRFWLDKKDYFLSWQSHCNFLYGFSERAKQVSAGENHPPHASCGNDTFSAFACENGKLFGCVSKTSCCVLASSRKSSMMLEY